MKKARNVREIDLFVTSCLLFFFSNSLTGTCNYFQAILSGCSAGGLTSVLNCDRFRGLLPRAARVKCIADAGYFINTYVFLICISLFLMNSQFLKSTFCTCSVCGLEYLIL